MLDHEDKQTLRDLTIAVGSVTAPVVALLMLQHPHRSKASSCWLADKQSKPSERAYEIFSLCYAPAWITAAAIVIATRAYDHWSKWSYLTFCSSCALPQIVLSSLLVDTHRPLHARFAPKAHTWLAVFSFVGNYWYTHYFYTVLRASYTFPSHMLNSVPVPLYLMTHPYFALYHTLARMIIRKAQTSFAPCTMRLLLQASLISAMSYVFAAAEALTIAGFPYYGFENRHAAIIIGSAFYGIYFLVSFPAYCALSTETPLHRVLIQALAVSMGVLQLLDFARLGIGVQLFVSEGERG
jgi:cycloeucalenol cycloisomerase